MLRTLFGCALLVLIIRNAHYELTQLPNRTPLPPRAATLRLDAVDIRTDADSPLRVTGAWKVTGDDPRIGGISGLALEGNRLLALTDNGSLIAFSVPPTSGSAPAIVRDLPAGPATPNFKAHRDSEAIVRDPRGRGWWVSFENVNQLWLYDADFSRALQRIRLGSLVVPFGNQGFEAAAADGADVLFFGEEGEVLLRVRGSRAKVARLAPPLGRISEAATLDGGRILALERRPTILGFRNRLVKLNKTAEGYVRGSSTELPVSRLDNFEAMAIDRTRGRTRLWLASDDSFEPPYQTVLLALDVDEKWLSRP